MVFRNLFHQIVLVDIKNWIMAMIRARASLVLSVKIWNVKRKKNSLAPCNDFSEGPLMNDQLIE